MSTQPAKTPWIPPYWFKWTAWKIHRALYRLTGGRFGLRRYSDGGTGMLRLTTTGRRSGKARHVIVSYVEDGPNLVLVSMNGWSDGEPAWALNLRATPEARVTLRDGTRDVLARLATSDERERLTEKLKPWMIEASEWRRSQETAVFVLEPGS